MQESPWLQTLPSAHLIMTLSTAATHTSKLSDVTAALSGAGSVPAARSHSQRWGA